MRLMVLLAVLLAQPHRINLHALPWTHVLDVMASSGPDSARQELESIGHSSRTAWERAYAFKWAAMLALREHHIAEATADNRAAMAADPGGYDARWAALGLVDVALVTHDWARAERTLGPLLRDPSPDIRMYAANREGQIRSHFRDGRLRVAAVVVGVLGWLLAIAAALKRRQGWVRRFGGALLVTEAMALAATAAVNRLATPLAQPGWMAGAIPGAVLVAAVIAGAPEGRARRVVLTVTTVLACVGMVYLGLDRTWWSVHQ